MTSTFKFQSNGCQELAPKPMAKQPLLLGLTNEEEKEKVLGNLTSLKDIEKYKGISIMEDLTPDQRKTIKELSSEAKKLNTKETSAS